MLRRSRFFSAVLARISANKEKLVGNKVLLVSSSSIVLKRFAYPAVWSISLVALAAPNAVAENQSNVLSLKEIAQITKKADDLFNQNKFEEILHLLRPYKDCQKEEILWRISRAAYKATTSKSISKEERAALVEESYTMAKLTLEMNENSALGHKWMSIASDEHSALQGIRSRLANLEVVRDHLVKSLELDPLDATVMYILGQWYYSLADLGWYQKNIIKAIRGSLPSASFEDALTFFKRAEETSPNFYSLNLLMLGKTHLKLGDQDTAMAYFQRVLDFPKSNDEDHQAHQEAAGFLKKLQGH